MVIASVGQSGTIVMAHSPNGKSEELSESYWLRVI
jgi:hypothetical protein